MNHVLGTPADVLPLYAEDDSSHLAVPVTGSKTPREHRIRYFHSRTAHQFLAGKSGVRLEERYVEILSRHLIANANLSHDCQGSADFSEFIQNLVFPAGIESICGTAILAINPTLTETSGMRVWTRIHIHSISSGLRGS